MLEQSINPSHHRSYSRNISLNQCFTSRLISPVCHPSCCIWRYADAICLIENLTVSVEINIIDVLSFLRKIFPGLINLSRMKSGKVCKRDLAAAILENRSIC